MKRRPTYEKLPAEFVALARRRTEPFLDRNGLNRPISLLLQEAYIQGLRDAAAVLETTP